MKWTTGEQSRIGPSMHAKHDFALVPGIAPCGRNLELNSHWDPEGNKSWSLSTQPMHLWHEPHKILIVCESVCQYPKGTDHPCLWSKFWGELGQSSDLSQNIWSTAVFVQRPDKVTKSKPRRKDQFIAAVSFTPVDASQTKCSFTNNLSFPRTCPCHSPTTTQPLYSLKLIPWQCLELVPRCSCLRALSCRRPPSVSSSFVCLSKWSENREAAV